MLQEVYQIAIHSIVSVLSLFFLTRLMGKREVSQLTFFDYVVGISVGSISASFAVDDSVSYVKGLTALITYTLFAILLSYLSLKSYVARRFINSQPTILIENGQIIEKGLKKTRMNINDLLAECRIKKVFNISDVELAVLETSGKLSLLLKSENNPILRKDMNLPIPPKNIAIHLIMDGHIIKQNLIYIGKDKHWLMEQLRDRQILSTSNVLLAFLDGNNQFQYYLKNQPPNPMSIS